MSITNTFINIYRVILWSSLSNMQGSGIGGGRGYTPLGRKNFKDTPPRRREASPPFFGRISEINTNLTGFSLN